MMHPSEREQAKRHMKDVWGAAFGLVGLIYFGLNSSAMSNEIVWVNVVMITGIVLLAYFYHLFAVVDIYQQWGIRQRLWKAVRPEVN